MVEFKPEIHYNKVLETYILGICLIEPAAFFKTQLKPDMFYFDEHRVVYTNLQSMAGEGIPIDLITATDYMQRHNRIPYILDHQTAWFLCKLTNDVIHSAHLTHWCEIIRKMWQARELARINPHDLQQAQATIKRIQGAPNQGISGKTYRFLLERLDSSLIRDLLPKYGARLIEGNSTYKIKVSTPLLVFLMAICEPEYTWTCGNYFDEELSNDQIKRRIPDNCRLDGSRNWINKTNQYPASW